MEKNNEKRKFFLLSLIPMAVCIIVYLCLKLLSGGLDFRDIISMNNLLYTGLLFPPELCIAFMFLSCLLMVLFIFLPVTSGISSVIYTLQICAAGYFIIEIFYHFIHFAVPVPVGTTWISEWIKNINIYLLHRSHQYIGLIFMLIVFFRTSSQREGSTLHGGNINYISGFLDPKRPLPWKYIALKLAGYFFIFSIMAFLLRHKTGDVINNLYMVVPLFLGALNNSFIEELLFRGIFLSSFKSVIDEKYANYLQALLFGLFHSQFIYLSIAISSGDKKGFLLGFLIQVAILTIYTFIGWIFGRASLETKGIGLSTFMHTCIVMAIYLSKGLVY
jgi:membrane protease YdiL (CAAX protease family)